MEQQRIAMTSELKKLGKCLLAVLDEFGTNPVDPPGCPVELAIEVTCKFLDRVRRPTHRFVSYSIH